MSEFINNRSHRKEELKAIIKRLHEGASVEEVKEDFDRLARGVTAIEITEMEQALVDEGLPVEDIQSLCDVHASVFKGSIEDIHAEDGFELGDFDEGHPVHTFKKENRLIEGLIDDQVLPLLGQYTENPSVSLKDRLLEAIEKLQTIDRHYARKENLLFPYMEKYNITAPPKVMWGVDDEIRLKLKTLVGMIREGDLSLPLLNQRLREVTSQIHEMIFKEEEIMIPMVLETFTHEEWVAIEAASKEVGYTLLSVVKRWLPKKPGLVPDQDQDKGEADFEQKGQASVIEGLVQFDAGQLTPEEINCILNTLPLDMTFVDANDQVKYFTQGKERIFDRPKTILGREVKNCHPPKSVHIVEQIVADLKSGKKDNEDFWIKMGDMFVYIRYFAVRSKEGTYLGTLEITQNIKPIMALEGEKRLRDE